MTSPLVAQQVASAISMILPLGKLSPLEVQQVSGFLIQEIYIPDVYSSDLIVPAKLEPKAKEKIRDEALSGSWSFGESFVVGR